MPKEMPDIPEEMPGTGNIIPEIEVPAIPESPEVPDEPPVKIPEEAPAPPLPEEQPPKEPDI